MTPTGDERQDLECRGALKDLFKYVFNEVSRLLKDYPSQSNTICEETSKLAVELQSLITYQKRHLGGLNVTTQDLVLFVTSMLALEDVTKNSSASLPTTTESSIPPPLLSGDAENVSDGQISSSLRQINQFKTSTRPEQSLDKSSVSCSSIDCISSQACSICRARKARCDEGKPRCAYCVENDLSCDYKHPAPLNHRRVHIEGDDAPKQFEENHRPLNDSPIKRDVEGEGDPRIHQSQGQFDSRHTTKEESENEISEMKIPRRHIGPLRLEVLAMDYQEIGDDLPLTEAANVMQELDDTEKMIESLFHKWTNLGHAVGRQLRS